MRAFNFFDRVYCIHLPNKERKERIKEELARVGVTDVTYVCADPPPSGFSMSNMRRNSRAEFGVNLSHIAAVTCAIQHDARNPLFIEDDVVFKGSKEAIQLALSHVPGHCEVLYLGGHPREPVRMINSRVAIVGKFSFAEAYSIKGGLLPRFIGYWCNRITKPDAMFDFILGEFAKSSGEYGACAIYPPITSQRECVSHVSGTVDKKSHLIEKGWANNLA